MQVQGTRTKRGVAVAILLIGLSAAVAGSPGASGNGRWPSESRGNPWSGETWQVASPAERQSYVRGITDGLRVAAMFERAQVDRGPVAQCVQQMTPERLTHAVGSHLEALAIEVDEPTLPFHAWDALVAMCLGGAGPRE
jgi:hypothetical protein